MFYFYEHALLFFNRGHAEESIMETKKKLDEFDAFLPGHFRVDPDDGENEEKWMTNFIILSNPIRSTLFL